VGKKRLTRKEDHPTTQVSAPLDSNAAPTLPIVDQNGPRPARPPDAESKDVRFSVRGRTHLLSLLIFLVVTAVFLPALRHDFVYYDDPTFVKDNPHVQGGFTWANLQWACWSLDGANWHPLTWLSHMLDVELFGLNPWGHHLTSVLLHALNSLLVFVVWRKMTGAVWRSLLVAALFGLHPLHVESVAWIAERKDVLSTLFWLLTIWAYAHWVRQRVDRRPRAWAFYGSTLGFFILGLMSKPMLVTVPCVLLLLDFWPLKRFVGIPRNSRTAVAWALVVEKLPFFALSAAVSVLTVVAQKHVGALTTMMGHPWLDRVSNALVAYCRYLGKCVFPIRLAVFYPNPSGQPIGRAVLAAVLLLGITGAVCALCRRRPYLLVGWLWFLGTLVPVIGLVQVGEQSMADRYSYMPLVGVFILLAWAGGEVVARWPQRTGLLGAMAGVILVGCTVLTSRQLSFWQDSTTLFRHALAVTEDNWAAHTYLGFALAKSPAHLSEAIAEYQAGLRIAPTVSEAHNYLAIALAQIPGRESDAIAEFKSALRLNPGIAGGRSNLATMLAKTPGRLPEAIAEYQAMLRLKPDSAEVHYYLGLALAKTPGREPEAIAELESALRLDPEFADALSNLATILAKTPGRLAEAIAKYQAAIRLKPDSAEMHYYLGLVLAEEPGRLSEAIGEFRTAVRLEPDSAEMHCNLGRALAQTSGPSAAVAEYQTALRFKPDYAEAHYGLGLVLARIPGRLPDAIVEYQAALRLQPDDAKVHNALGNAWSEMPDHLPEAIVEFQTALRLQPDFVEVHNNLGIALAQLPGRLPEAVAEYETVLRVRPDFAEAHFNLGNALAGIPGRLPEAIAEYGAAVRAQPGFAEAHNNLADALARTPGRTAEAIAEYETAIRANPGFFQAHFNLGLLLASLPGRQSEAVGHFASALEIKPDFEPARTMLDRLRATPQ
jgi:protein O-mannosyl-transferase